MTTTTINLLPWREERRQQLKQQFFAVLAVSAFVGAGAVYLYNMVMESRIGEQQARNALVVAETKKLDERISEIDDLKKQRTSLIERMNVIQELQGNRPVIVHVFDQVAKTLPDGVFLSRIQARDTDFVIDGKAEANNRISNFMRNMSKSEMFASPNLSRVQAIDRNGEAWSEFSMGVKRGAPKKADDGGEK